MFLRNYLKNVFLLFLIHSYATAQEKSIDSSVEIVRATKKISLDLFPDAYNPSLLRMNNEFILTFRFCPDRAHLPWLSYIGIVCLNDAFEPISTPQLLNTRLKNSKIPSQSEDARIFQHQGKLFLIYNDNVDAFAWASAERRDMFIAELVKKGHHFTLGEPTRLIYPEKYPSQEYFS